MDPEELARQEAAAAAAEARLAALTAGGGDPPPDPPAEDDPTDPPAEDPPAEDPPADPPAEDPPADPPAPRRGSRTLEARIGGLAAEKRALLVRTAELEAENARLRAGTTPPADPPAADPPPTDPQRNQFRTQAEFNAAVVAEAERQANLLDWNNRCNKVEDKGSKLGDRWDAAKRNLALLDDNGVIPFPILEMALETDAPEKVILTLGEDPDRAAEILAMRPAKRALEIAKMAAGPELKIPARSAAPPPVDPLKGRGAPAAATTPTDRDSDDEWLRKRNADIDAKRIAAAARQRSMS